MRFWKTHGRIGHCYWRCQLHTSETTKRRSWLWMSRTRFEARINPMKIINAIICTYLLGVKWIRAHHTTETKENLHNRTAVVCNMTPCSLVNTYRCFGGTRYLHHQGRREHPYEEASSSAMSVHYYQTARRLIPEDSNLHSHRCQKISSDLQNMLSRKFSILNWKKKKYWEDGGASIQ